MEKTAFARRLRNNMTPAEKRLWALLRRRAFGVRFCRQVPRGPYVLDFVCLEHRLVVEVDGSQHADSASDVIRDAWLESKGYRVLRFWNHDVLRNADGVCQAIRAALNHPSS